MGLLGTLTKVAIGYATARGVDRMAGGQGLQGVMDQIRKTMEQAQGRMPGQAPGMAEAQSPFAGFGSAGESMQQMLSQMMPGAQGAGTGTGTGTGTGSADSRGMLGRMEGAPGGAGLAAVLAAMGGLAAKGQTGMETMMTQAGAGQATEALEEHAGLMLRAMIQAAKADGRIDEDEQARILGLVGDDAEEADVTFLRTQLAAPVDIEGLAADTPAPVASQVYAMSLMPIRVDTDAERAYLRDLAAALGLDEQTVVMLHMQMGAPTV